jgi:hypothetical protein
MPALLFKIITMAANIFEGARRVALFVGALVCIGTLVGVFTDQPNITLRYTISLPGVFPVLRKVECPDAGATEYLEMSIVGGKSVHVILCFWPMRFLEEEKLLVPYLMTDEKVWGAQKYSDGVRSYTRGVAASFRMPDKDEAEAEDLWDKERRSNILYALGYLALGLIIFWIFVWVIGWVVRGFLGIPNGMDRRPEQSN